MIQVMNQTGLQMEYDVGQIAEEAIRSMGISDLDRFRISEEARQQGMSPSQQMAMAQADRGATGKTMANEDVQRQVERGNLCLLYTSPSPRDGLLSRMPSSA